MVLRRIVEAIERGDSAGFRDILSSGYLVETPLEYIDQLRLPNGSIEEVEWKCTALHLATRFNHTDMVMALYKNGANIDAELTETRRRYNSDGQVIETRQNKHIKASGIALQLEYREMTLLLNNLRNRTKSLREAVTTGTAKQVAECLHDGGTPPDLPITWTERYRNQGLPEQMTFTGTLLHYCVAKAQLDKIRVLIAFGADTGKLLTFKTAREDLLTGKVLQTGDQLTTSTLTLAHRTRHPEIVAIIEAAAVASEESYG